MADDLDARLRSLNRDQLIAVVRRLVRHEPDLEDLVHLPLPDEEARVDGGRICAQVSRIVRNIGWDWRASSHAERELGPVLITGQQLLDRGALDGARVVFRTTAETILEHYESFRDNESEVGGVVNECVRGLGECLERASEPDVRAGLIDEILAVWIWDRLDHGGYGMDGPAQELLTMHATGQERREIAGKVRASLPRHDANYGRWRRQGGGEFVLELIGHELSPREREWLYEEASLEEPLLELLIDQDRWGEAVSLVRRSAPETVEKLAEKLATAGMVLETERAVLEHQSLLEPESRGPRRWLTSRSPSLLPPGIDEAVDAVRRFRNYPNISHYKNLRSRAEAVGRWPDVLQLVEGVKPDAKAVRPVRARMYADLGRIDDALSELGELTGSSWRSATADVARSLEEPDPAAAAELYRALIAHLVEHDTKHSRQAVVEHQQRLDELSSPTPTR